MPVPLVQIQLSSRVVARLSWAQAADLYLLPSVLLIATAFGVCVSLGAGIISAACMKVVYSCRLASVLTKLGNAVGFISSGVTRIFGRLFVS